MAYLRIETRDGVQRVPLDRDRLRIGRLASNEVILPYRQISREHAEVERAGSEWWISDLDSTNGLQVGGRPVDRYPLRPGERIYLAPDITVALAADDEEFEAQATTQMGVAGGPAEDLAAAALAGRRPGPGAPPLLLHLGPGGTSDPFAPPAGPLAESDLERSAEAWRATRSGASSSATSGASWPQRDERRPSRMEEDPEGDLFRRRSGAPSRGSRAQRGARDSSAGTVMLHVCQTCGQLTPASGLKCQFCHHPLARPCQRCGMSLLPADDYCPRCQSANPGAARRRAPSGGR